MHIHIISPSGAIDNALIDNAVTRLQQWGYETSVAPHARGRYGRFAGTPAQRADDINAALCNPDIDIVLCSRGGYGLQQIADRIVVPTFHTPLLVGFSDITLLHNLLGLRHIPTLHASMCKYIATLDADNHALQLLQQALHGEPLQYMMSPHPLQRTGQCRGMLIGGNLSVLYGLQDTPYSLNRLIDTCSQPPILFLEDIGERHYHLDRMMNNLRMSGVLSRLGGLVLGQFTDCEDDPLMGCTALETLVHAAEQYDYPILVNFPAGHVPNNVPLQLNSMWRMTVEETGAALCCL